MTLVRDGDPWYLGGVVPLLFVMTGMAVGQYAARDVDWGGYANYSRRGAFGSLLLGKDDELATQCDQPWLLAARILCFTGFALLVLFLVGAKVVPSIRDFVSGRRGK